MECYGAGADDTHAAELVYFDNVTGSTPARAPGGDCVSDRLVCQAAPGLLGHSSAWTGLAGL